MMVLYHKSIGSLHEMLRRVQIHFLFLHCSTQSIPGLQRMLSLQILQGHQTELGQAREFLAKGVLRREAHLSMKDIHVLQKTAVPKKVVKGAKVHGEGYLMWTIVILLIQITQILIAVRCLINKAHFPYTDIC